VPSISVNSSNINTFNWAANVDIQNRIVTFDTSATQYVGGGIGSVLGICFSMVDSQGVELAGVDWTNPQIVPSVSKKYVLDLDSFPINFLFQNYQLIGYIRDSNGTIYQTVPILKALCLVPEINDNGYVDGCFSVTPDCLNNILTVREFTVFIYNNLTPLTITKSGTLFYPTGTLAPIPFTGTPFSNNVVITGTYRVNCTSIATYDLGDGIAVSVSYYTDHEFPIVCSNFMGEITCCVNEVLDTYRANCENAVGQAALHRYNSVTPFITLGTLKQINGQDASKEVAEVKKMLNCNCGTTSVRQNEASPVNPNYSIVLQGQGGTTALPAYITGSTKVYNIASNTYVVGKGILGDLAYSISTDTSTPNVVRYLLTYNYNLQAGYNLNAIAADPTLLNQLNSLVTSAGGAFAGLDGKCVIDLTKSNYSLSQTVNSSTLITNIVINGSNYSAPSNLFGNGTTSIATWLNSLTLGTFSAALASNMLTIQSVSNSNTVSTITFTTPNLTKLFSSTNATALQIMQAVVNYMCGLTDNQVQLYANLNLCTFDYNGNIVTTSFTATQPQSVYNAGVASAICNIANRMANLAGATCASLKTLFVDRPTVSFGVTDRLYGTLGGNCSSLTDQQIANMVIAAVGKYADVKSGWCAINCNAIPSCPDISNTSINMSGANIGVYGLTWNTTPLASQTVSVRYRISGTLTWTTTTNSLLILPNGNINGTTPYIISGTSMGTTYDVQLINNCGGIGFIKQITTPTGSVYTGQYLLDNILYNICGESLVTLYSSNPFGSGTIMYTNIGLTAPITGYTYITTSGRKIYALNNTTGLVGVDTGSSCANGTSGSFILGNDTSTICGGATVTRYTNGAFAVGGILYIDSALSMPQTGFSYVVFGGTIYNLNSGTGTITGTSGLSCNNYTLSPAYNFSITSVTGTGIPTLPPTGTSGNVFGHHTAVSGALSITVNGTIVLPTKLDVSVNGILKYCVAVTASGTYTTSAITALETDSLTISIDSGTC
jgi:hypothetical protein